MSPINKDLYIFRTMLAVSIKLNHIVISMINRITRSRLKPNGQTTVNGHINDVTTKILADS